MKRQVVTACLVWALSATCLQAVELGSLNGTVRQPSGQPAAGVAVSVRSVGSMLPVQRKTLSNPQGQFQFSSLFPGVYVLEIFSMDPWNIVSKELIVTPGKNDPLVVHLSDILTMAFNPPRITTERENPTEDAKWVLRTSRVTRPVLRFQDSPGVSTVADNTGGNSLLPFRGVLDISSADTSNNVLDGNPFVSSFAFVHTLSPSTQLLVAGGIGIAGSSQTSVRSALNIKMDNSHTATISLGLRQFGLNLLNASELSQALASLSDGNNSLSQIQNYLISLDLQDRYRLSDRVELMAGAAFDHVESARTRNIIRPRMAITAELTPNLRVQAIAMNTTTERAKTFNLPEGETITLPSMARMTVSPNALYPESVNHFELSVEQQLTQAAHLMFSIYQDQFKDRVLYLSNLDPVDVGNSMERGYAVALLANPSSQVSISMGYTRAGGLEPSSLAEYPEIAGLEPGRLLRTRYYHVLSGGVGFTVPRFHTHFDTLYRKIFGSPLTIIDPFQTSFYASEGGFNLMVTQPLPNFTSLPGQLEAQADFRNLFGQGMSRTEGLSPFTLLSQQPRVIRGGLSFKF